MLGLDVKDLSGVLLGHADGDLAVALVLEHVVETNGGDFITSRNEVVIGLVGEGERDDTLLLQVGLVDTGKALDKDDAGSQIAGL